MTETVAEPEVDIHVNKKVEVKLVSRENSWLPKNHDGETQFTGAKFGVDLPRSKNGGQFLNPFKSEKEREAFEKALFMEDGELSIYKRGNNFWKTFKVALDKDGKVLDLSDPMDHLSYKVLKQNSHVVAPSWNKRYHSPGYRFALVEEDEMIEEKVQKSDLRKKAYRFARNIEDNKTKMYDFLRVYHAKFTKGIKIPSGAKKDWYISEIEDLITDDTKLKNLLSVIEDDNYEMKLFIEDAIEAGAIVKPGKNSYQITGTDEEFGQLEMIAYLNPKGKHQDVYLKIKEQIKLSNDG